MAVELVWRRKKALLKDAFFRIASKSLGTPKVVRGTSTTFEGSHGPECHLLKTNQPRLDRCNMKAVIFVENHGWVGTFATGMFEINTTMDEGCADGSALESAMTSVSTHSNHGW
jgi:hypothetical protein